MSIPANIKAVTVTARYVKADGSPASGLVRFALSAPAAVPVDKAMVPLISVKATLDAAGSISVVLAASDDPDWSVTGLTYQVTERITGAELRTYNVTIPAAAPGGTVDLASLAPAVPGPALVAYVLAAAVGAPTGVASLDAAGQVPLSQLGNAPAGGGAGAVASVNGQTGAVVLDAADVDADPAGSATGQVAAHVAAADPHGDRAHADGLVDALDQATAAALAGKADTGHQHLALRPYVRRARVTTGNIALPNTAGVWTPVPGVELAVPADVGEDVELQVGLMWQPGASQFLDLAVVVGAALVRFATTSDNTRPGTDEGLPDFYPQPGTFARVGGFFGFTVQAGDLDNGTVRFVVATKGPGGGTLYASATYPLRMRARNDRTVL